ncbi:helix-turn-helix transcriptional regulator [Kitasatospora aureofaciens]
MQATEAPLRSIAAPVGYASESAFANAFKRTRGPAPGAYRRLS